MATENPLITPSQIRAARALLDWSQGDLAKAAGASASPQSATMSNERRSAREDDGPDGCGRTIGGLGTIRRSLENEGCQIPAGAKVITGQASGIIARTPNVLRWPTKLGKWKPLLIPVEWRGQAVNVFVSHEVLEDLGRFRESQPDAEYLRVYEEHRADILRAAAVGIDAGRMTPDRRVHLTDADFEQLRYKLRTMDQKTSGKALEMNRDDRPFSRRFGYTAPAQEITVREDAPDDLRAAVVMLADGLGLSRAARATRHAACC